MKNIQPISNSPTCNLICNLTISNFVNLTLRALSPLNSVRTFSHKPCRLNRNALASIYGALMLLCSYFCILEKFKVLFKPFKIELKDVCTKAGQPYD